ADDVGARAVMPTLAWVEQQGTAEWITFARPRLEVAQNCTRERIAEAGCVGEDMSNGRRPACRAEPIDAARRVERFEDLQVCKLRQILFDRIVESEAALLDKLHGRRRRDQLGHRGDAEQRVGRERAPARDVCHAEGTLIEHAPTTGDQRDYARHVLALNRAAQRRVDARACRRILRAHRDRGCSKHDGHADANSNDLSIHASLPIDAPPGCRRRAGPSTLYPCCNGCNWASDFSAQRGSPANACCSVDSRSSAAGGSPPFWTAASASSNCCGVAIPTRMTPIAGCESAKRVAASLRLAAKPSSINGIKPRGPPP